MKAIILAAGRGSRMGGLTADRPKCLVEFRGRALLDWQLDAIRGAGLEEIGIVTGYRPELLSGRGLTAFHNPRWTETNMVSSLACARAWLETDVCLISYSDIFYGADAIDLMRASSAPLAITYDPDWLRLWSRRFADPLSDAETFRLDPDGFLAEIGNTPSKLEGIQGQYMGLLRITPAGWRELLEHLADLTEDERSRMHMTGLLQKAVSARGLGVQALPYHGEWGEIDSESDLAAYEKGDA